MSEVADRYSTGVLSHDIPTELQRLQLLERTLDPATIRILAEREVPEDARCLVLGAGAGSIARWLAERFPAGQVVAVDIDTRYLEPGPNLEVRQADVRTLEVPEGSFDLIQARALFMHLPEREEALAKAATWLVPGGWLVAQDLVHPLAESSPHPVWRRVLGAMIELIESQGADLSWARSRQPAALAEAGLDDLGMAMDVFTIGDGSPCEEFWRVFIRQVAPNLVGRGLLPPDDLAAVLALFDDPEFIEPGETLISAWGRRPEPE